jgi:hypothetical protein
MFNECMHRKIQLEDSLRQNMAFYIAKFQNIDNSTLRNSKTVLVAQVSKLYKTNEEQII